MLMDEGMGVVRTKSSEEQDFRKEVLVFRNRGGNFSNECYNPEIS